MLTAILLATALHAPADAAVCRLGDAATCTRGCDSGEMRACVVLGNMLIDGVGIDKDSKRGDALFQKACKKGDGEGCNAHGVVLREKILDGKDEPLPTDWAVAFGFFQKACAANAAKGCNNAAAAIVDGHIPGSGGGDGVLLFRKSCEIEGDGSATGCFEYGQALSKGKNIAKDDVLAAKWLARGCRLGAGEACSMAEDLGEKVVMTPEAKARLERARCDAGDAKTCAHMGAVLLKTNPAKALEPLKIACLAEQAEACTSLGEARLFGENGSVELNFDEATAALDKACGLDDAHACRLLGDAVLVGHAIARDVDRAVALYKRACALGDATGCKHESGVAMAKSIKRTGDDVAATVLTKDCKGGDAEACQSLKGLGKPAKVAEGSKKLGTDNVERACETGVGRSCFDAGKKAERSEPNRARYFYDLGCKIGYPKACAEAGALFDGGKAGTVDHVAALDAFARGCSLGNADACSGAADAARRLGGNAVARAKPVLEQACTAKVGAACEAAGRLE